jgi:iron complex transport system permease protein
MSYILLRPLCAFLAGLIISQTGSFIQIGTRNVLASPSTLGIEGLAVLWILLIHSLAIFLGIESHYIFLTGVPVFALVGYFLSRLVGKEMKLERVLFMGITLNLLVGAIFSLWQFFFLALNLPFPMEIWFGHFRYVEDRFFWILLTLELFICFFLRIQWKNLQLYSLGGSLSRAFAANIKSLYVFLFIAAICGTYIVIALFGAFSFLGLLLPLIARKFWFDRFDLKGELFIGAVVNGFFFMLFDFACYQWPVLGAEIPVGLIASVVGAVCLIGLIWHSHKGPEFLSRPGK